MRRGRTVLAIDDPWEPSEPAGLDELAEWELEGGAPADVAWVQRGLNQVMNAGLAEDGLLGPLTGAAIMAFQQSRGLTPDGIAGPPTIAALQAAIAAAPPSASPVAPAGGVGTFDGKLCASWLIPYLTWAREHGWQGKLNSGWRDPVYSEGLCLKMCGAPTCPGRCAGRTSNHAGDVKPKGAVDVSDYVRFGQLMAQCPLSPRIRNNLPKDLVHFSVSGG
jgi:hypothetical protein